MTLSVMQCHDHGLASCPKYYLHFPSNCEAITPLKLILAYPLSHLFRCGNGEAKTIIFVCIKGEGDIFPKKATNCCSRPHPLLELVPPHGRPNSERVGVTLRALVLGWDRDSVAACRICNNFMTK